MTECYRIIAINVGSTSTKIAYLKGSEPALNESVTYSRKVLSQYSTLQDELPCREKDVLKFFKKYNINSDDIDIIVCRGGLGKPGPAGAYAINGSMCDDLLTGKYGKHPSALGPAMAYSIGCKYNIRAIVIDPPSTDEFHDIARLSGLPGIERKSAFHALNQKAAARRAAAEIDKKYEDINLVVAHMGGGITIGAHKKGKVIDCTNGLSEGPFTPERAGGLPTFDIIEMVMSEKFTKKEMEKKLVGQGGLSAYLGTADAPVIQEYIKDGDREAELVFKAMAYQVIKDIGAMFAVLKGNVQGIVLTGGLAQSELLIHWIKEWLSDISPVFIYPGEDEMLALAEGAIRVLRGEETIQDYT